jgi:3-hydroxyisobutyrate dehydrogenase-like beta-hydroxyacid dehydrogenase
MDAGAGRAGVVGFVGAGRIGEPMVARLLGAGVRVKLYSRRADVRERMAAAGADLVPDAGGIARADVVISCLYHDSQVLDVLPAVVGSMDPRAVLVSHTTGTPATLRRLSELAGAGGPGIVDAPFSGTADAVRAGRLTMFLGGEPQHTAAARAVVRAYADPVVTTGGPGSALRVKLLNNLLFAAISQLTLRALAAGRDLGVAEDRLLAALAVSSGGSAAAGHIAAAGGSAGYTAGVAPFLRKDIAACQELAAELSVDLSALLDAAGAGPMDLSPHLPADAGR